jgi:hypothetical protein
MHLLRPCAAGSGVGEGLWLRRNRIVDDVPRRPVHRPACSCRQRPGQLTTCPSARISAVRLLVQVLGPRLGTTASSASPDHRMTLLLSRSNNFSRHALIFPLLILTIGRSDAAGTGRTDQQVSAGRVRCAEFLAPTGSPSAPRHERRTGRTSECSASPTAATPFPRAQLQPTGSAQLTAAPMLFPIINRSGVKSSA